MVDRSTKQRERVNNIGSAWYLDFDIRSTWWRWVLYRLLSAKLYYLFINYRCFSSVVFDIVYPNSHRLCNYSIISIWIWNTAQINVFNSPHSNCNSLAYPSNTFHLRVATRKCLISSLLHASKCYRVGVRFHVSRHVRRWFHTWHAQPEVNGFHVILCQWNCFRHNNLVSQE